MWLFISDLLTGRKPTELLRPPTRTSSIFCRKWLRLTGTGQTNYHLHSGAIELQSGRPQGQHHILFTQIDVTTRDLKATRREPKEGFSEFVARWRAKASMMTTRPSKKDHIRMGLITDKKEQAKRPFVHSSNATTSGSTAARPSDVSVVTTITKTTNPFANIAPQTSNNLARSKRTFTPLYMPLSQAMKVLIKKGHLKPLEPRPLPDPLPPKHKPAKYCAFHQQHSHNIDQCFKLRHEIQDLINNNVIAPPQKANVTTIPLLAHN
ncbi:hypothetical protein HYC85_029938 [Camellia sinensis]|uniref:Retrotransposon gag domain-containing protein n=1 Tax=Camellia sinensis TaxID=4442 RepID=A0A7J7G000_CAMSI|nr:hypothetical protein HYC85_029938 [Camellia sinensis]